MNLEALIGMIVGGRIKANGSCGNGEWNCACSRRGGRRRRREREERRKGY